MTCGSDKTIEVGVISETSALPRVRKRERSDVDSGAMRRGAVDNFFHEEARSAARAATAAGARAMRLVPVPHGVTVQRCGLPREPKDVLREPRDVALALSPAQGCTDT